MKDLLYLGVTQFVEQHKKYLSVNNIYRDIHPVLKPFRKLWFDFNLPLKKIWLTNNLYADIKCHQTIILSATQFNLKVSKIIDNFNFKDKRFIFWYWNPVGNIGNPTEVSKNWEIWSFDKRDCEKYNLSYNNTYYFNEFLKFPKIVQPMYDVLFIGQDKGRIQKLIKISDILDFNQLTYYFHVVRDSTSKISYSYKHKIDYNEILKLTQSSKVLLDIVQKGQSGLTLRVMESLFFSKKIITNNSSIVNYNFYNPQNVFILGIDNTANLVDFITSEPCLIDLSIINQYTISNWLENFGAKNG